MKKLNLFTKIITPIVVLGILFSYMGYFYLNIIVEENINHEIEQKVEYKANYMYKNIESDFKLLFYLYGTSPLDYGEQESLIKKELSSKLEKKYKDSDDILYIIDPNEYIQVSRKYLTSSELSTIVRTNQNKITVDEVTYEIKQLHFKPWDWRIIYLLDTSNFEDILSSNKAALLGIIYVMLLFLIILIIVIFKIYIKNPIDILLSHFNYIIKGKYKEISNVFNTLEIDQLISNVNDMTKSIESREKETKDLLALTQKNEEYMEDILSSQSSIIIINDTVKILDVNDSFLKFFSDYNSLEEFQEDHECICDYFVKEEGYIYTFEDKNWVEYVVNNPHLPHKVKILKDNKYFIYTINAKKSVKYKRTIITMMDITELEKSTHLLEQYKKAVDAGTIVSKTDPKGVITYVNDKFVNISGYTREDLINANHNVVNSPNMDKAVFKDMWKTIKSKKIWFGNIENRKNDGSSYYVAATLIPILDENNNIIEYIALRYDITEQVLAVEKAKKAENVKGLFLANMSHEIRTPLNAIIGFTKILKNSKLENKEANYIDVIDKSAENLLGIVNDVLDISKIESGHLVCEKVEFNPFKEFNAVSDLFSAKAQEKSINLISVIDPKILQRIIGDPLRIKQVLSNLISNAIKFSSEHSKIELDIKLISQAEESCVISFSLRDYGIGISENKQKTIFEDFSQADSSTSREYGGTGLGLSISNKIVQALGSNIQIESEENEGSRFFFELEYKTNVSNNKNLEDLNKLKIGIILSNNITEYDYEYLKTYLESVTDLTIYENSDDYESIVEEDIIFIAENSKLKNIQKIDNSNKVKIIILSHEKSQCDKFQNSIILNTPFNRSIVFDILIGFFDKDKEVEDFNEEDYKQYTGNILIAEDYIVNQQLISILLELRGIQHTFAENGQEAVDLFKKGTYDLVLMDINMPIKNGKEATAEIIDYEIANNLRHTPIVALTANAIESDKEETMKIGFDDYLLKPLDEIRLDEVFHKYLQSEKKEKEIIIEKEPIIEVVKTVYDLEEASKKSGLPSTVMKKIVTSFIATVDNDLSELKNAIESENFVEIKNCAHKIKGAALNLRMENIANVALKIESQGLNTEGTSLDEDFEDLEKEILVIKEQVQ